MIVLGLDTATAATAVALRLADGTLREARDDPPAGAHPGHATRLLAMAHELLEEAGVPWGRIGRIGAGAGPGTFTGLRVGLATARGLAQSLGAELTTVSSALALARPALEQAAGRPVLAAIDARRGEVFAALYGAGGQELAAPRPLAPAALGELLADAGGPALAVGDGALRYRAEVEAAGALLAPEASGLHLLRAGAVCELAAAALGAPGLQAALPDYRRRPDAELALQGAGTEAGR